MAFGSSDREAILRLARLKATNPWLDLGNLNNSRSVAAREATRLLQQVGPSRTFLLPEVVDLLVTQDADSPTHRVLIGPEEMLDATAPGGRLTLIKDYLLEILRQAEDEVLLLAPFWEATTLVDLLRAVPRNATSATIALFLVETKPFRLSAASLMDKVLSVWPSKSARLYVHRASGSGAQDYPHAKCLLVDGKRGYVGSANFTEAGMSSHFELGLAIDGRDCDIIAQVFKHLRSQAGLFSLAWSQ